MKRIVNSDSEIAHEKISWQKKRFNFETILCLLKKDSARLGKMNCNQYSENTIITLICEFHLSKSRNVMILRWPD